MYYDRNRATLHLTRSQLKELLHASASGNVVDAPPEWEDGRVLLDGEIDPIVASIARVALNGDRTVVIERFDGDEVAPVWLAWDRAFRATVTEQGVRSAGGDAPTDDDVEMAITATQFELLPGLVRQLVRLHPRLPVAKRSALTTTAGVIDDILLAFAAGDDPPASGATWASDPDLAAVLGASSHAWRASGNWRTQPTDNSMTVLDASTEGLWIINRPAPDAPADRETPVTLLPATPEEVTARLGDVVTGRAAPDPTVQQPGAEPEG